MGQAHAWRCMFEATLENITVTSLELDGTMGFMREGPIPP